MRGLAVGLAAALALALAAGCGGGEDGADRAAQGVAREVATPAFAASAETGATLAGAVEGLCADPSEASVAEARAAWSAARGAWSRTEAFWIGPVMDRRSEGLVDWPESVERVDEIAAGPSAPDDRAAVLSLSTSVRGLGALEHLLFADGTGTAARMGAEPRRCAYAQAVSGVIGDETGALARAWASGEDGEPAYAESLAGQGPAAIDGSEAVGMLVERHLFLAERIADTELGASLGSRGAPDPGALDEAAAAEGARDIADRLAGVRAAYAPGAEGTRTLGDLLGDRDADVRDRLVEQLDAAIADAEAIDGTLAADPAGRRTLRDAVTQVETTLATEVVSVLGVTVGFSDNDGDSG